MARFNTEAIVLKKINYQDADRIYTLLSKDRGKISAVAKGVRKISSRRSGNLDTLNYITVSLSEDARGYKTIQEVKLTESYKHIKADLKKSLAGYYMIELVNKSVEEDADAHKVFDLLRDMLGKLNEDGANISFFVNKFEVLLMKNLGYEISLEKLRSFGRAELNAKIKKHVRESLDTDFKSLSI
ncbi:MAG: hypothetical protein ACD_22C00237G0004 [uncultured bacterium]|nr:MAG: hypothetical protein ACD_22C00237G0004 [uncultured bacterium]